MTPLAAHAFLASRPFRIALRGTLPWSKPRP